MIKRSIVNDDYMIISILLVEYALNVELESKILSVIEAGHDDAKRDLLRVFSKLVQHL